MVQSGRGTGQYEEGELAVYVDLEGERSPEPVPSIIEHTIWEGTDAWLPRYGDW